MVSSIVRVTMSSYKSVLVLACVMGMALALQPAFAQDAAPAPVKVKRAKKKKATPAADATSAPAAAETQSAVKSGGGEIESSSPQGENLKFNTDSAPVSTDRHPP